MKMPDASFPGCLNWNVFHRTCSQGLDVIFLNLTPICQLLRNRFHLHLFWLLLSTNIKLLFRCLSFPLSAEEYYYFIEYKTEMSTCQQHSVLPLCFGFASAWKKIPKRMESNQWWNLWKLSLLSWWCSLETCLGLFWAKKTYYHLAALWETGQEEKFLAMVWGGCKAGKKLLERRFLAGPLPWGGVPSPKHI